MALRISDVKAHLSEGDRLSTLIKGHLWVERSINDALTIASQRPSELRLDRWTFATKVDMAAALGCIDPEHTVSIRKLNGLRNRAAHRLDYDVSDGEVDEFARSLPLRLQGIVAEENGESPPLHNCLYALIFSLEVSNARASDERKWGLQRAVHGALTTIWAGDGVDAAIADERARRVADPPPPPGSDDIFIPSEDLS